MIREVQERVNKLETTISNLEELLSKFGHLSEFKTFEQLKQVLNLYKRELQIRKDYPT